MGFYLETEAATGKAAWLMKNAQATRLNHAGEVKIFGSFSVVPPDKMLVCVVHNPTFEAAGICFDVAEFRAFAAPDSRRKEWLLVPKSEIIRLKPHLKEFVENGNWRD